MIFSDKQAQNLIKSSNLYLMKALINCMLFLVLFASCELKTHKDVDVKEFKKGKEAMKIKRFTEDQIFVAAYQYGDSLLTKLRGKIDFKTANLCELVDLKDKAPSPLILKAGIRCKRNQVHHEKEAALWDAFQKIDIENQNLFQNTIQRLGNADNYTELVAVYPVPFITESDTSIYMLSIVISKREVIKTL